jgi:hypothetical protein
MRPSTSPWTAWVSDPTRLLEPERLLDPVLQVREIEEVDSGGEVLHRRSGTRRRPPRPLPWEPAQPPRGPAHSPSGRRVAAEPPVEAAPKVDRGTAEAIRVSPVPATNQLRGDPPSLRGTVPWRSIGPSEARPSLQVELRPPEVVAQGRWDSPRSALVEAYLEVAKSRAGPLEAPTDTALGVQEGAEGLSTSEPNGVGAVHAIGH